MPRSSILRREGIGRGGLTRPDLILTESVSEKEHLEDSNCCSSPEFVKGRVDPYTICGGNGTTG